MNKINQNCIITQSQTCIYLCVLPFSNTTGMFKQDQSAKIYEGNLETRVKVKTKTSI